MLRRRINSVVVVTGGPLTEERIKTLGIVKMNDYIKSGTRQQFWEEYYVRVVMQVGGRILLRIKVGNPN